MKSFPETRLSKGQESFSFHTNDFVDSTWARLAQALTSNEDPKKLSSIFGMICSCLQIWTIFALTSIMTLSQEPNEDWRAILEYIGHLVSLEKLLGPGFESKSILPLVLFYIYFIGIIISLGKVVKNRNSTSTSVFLRILKGIAIMHSPAMFYPIHFILLRIIQTNRSGEFFPLIQTFSYILLIMNFLFSLLTILCLQIPIKTSEVLSSKTNITNTLDFCIKALFPIVYTTLKDSQNVWIFMLSFNLCYSLLRDFLHFYTLPYYQIMTLKRMTSFSAIITSFSLVAVICKILSFIGVKEADVDLLIVLWIFICLICIRLYLSHLEKVIKDILISPNSKKNFYHILHFWSTYKHFSLHSTEKMDQSEDFSREDLIYTAFLEQLPKNLKTSRKGINDENNDHMVRVDVCNLYMKLLEESIIRYPQSFLLKATLALFYIKSDRVLLANSIILKNFQRTGPLRYKLLHHLLRFKLQQKIFDKSNKESIERKSDTSLNIQAFVKANQISKTLNNLIKSQLDNRVKFWKTLQMPRINANYLITYTNTIHRQIKELEAYWITYENLKDHQSFESLLVYGHYLTQIQEQANLGNSLIKKYTDSITRQGSDLSKTLKAGHKMTTSSSAWFIVSGMPDELGYVLDCSSNVESKLKVDKRFVQGKSINSLMPSFFAKQHDHLMISPADVAHRCQETLLLVRGHLVRSWIEVSLSYSFDRGLYYFVLLEPAIDDKMIILIQEDGIILDTSDSFERKVRRNCKETSIQAFCPDLNRVLSTLSAKNKNTLANEVYQNHNENTKLTFYAAAGDGDSAIVGGSGELYTVNVKTYKYQEEHVFKLEIGEAKAIKKVRKLKTPKLKTITNTISLSQIPETISLHTNLLPKANLVLGREIKTLSSGSGGNGEVNSRESLGSETQRLELTHDVRQSNNSKVKNGEQNPSFEFKKDQVSAKVQAIAEEHHKDDERSVTSTYNQSSKLQKNLKHLLNITSHSKSARIFIATFFFLMIAVSCFLVWFSISTYKVSDQIATVSNVLQRTYFKTFFTNLAHQELRFITACKIYYFDGPDAYPYDLVYPGFYKASTRLEKYHDELWLALEKADTHVKDWFFEKNIRTLTRDENDTLITVDICNPLEATERLLSSLHFILHESTPEAVSTAPDVETRYYFDNSVNDLLISSENIISLLGKELQSIFKRIHQSNTLLFFSSVSVLILLLINSVDFMARLRRDFVKFGHVIFTISRDDSSKIEQDIFAFQRTLEGSFDFSNYQNWISEDRNRLIAKPSMLRSKKDVNPKERFVRDLQMREMYIELLLILTKFVALLLIILICLLLYYQKAQTQTELMDKQQVIITSALDNVQQQTLLSVQLQSLVFDNDTITIRNRPIQDGFGASIQRLKEVTRLQNLFKNYKGEFSPENKEILFSIRCIDVISPFYYLTPDILLWECFTLANGEDTISLVTLFPQMADQVSSFLDTFEESSRDYSGIKDIYNVFTSELSLPIDLTLTLLLLSYSVTVTEFDDLLSTLLKEGTQLLVGALLVLIVVTTMMWFLVIKRLAIKEFERKKILALMPGDLISRRNIYLKKYVIDMLDQDVRTLNV